MLSLCVALAPDEEDNHFQVKYKGIGNLENYHCGQNILAVSIILSEFLDLKA